MRYQPRGVYCVGFLQSYDEELVDRFKPSSFYCFFCGQTVFRTNVTEYRIPLRNSLAQNLEVWHLVGKSFDKSI